MHRKSCNPALIGIYGDAFKVDSVSAMKGERDSYLDLCVALSSLKTKIFMFS